MIGAQAALLALLAATEVASGAPEEALRAALGALPGADVILFDEPRPGRATALWVAGRVRTPVERLRPLLLDPAAYQRALPSFRRAEVVGTRRTRAGEERQIAWELEVPLWNLRGRMWLRPIADGAEFLIDDGDLAPGKFRLRALADGAASVLFVEGHANTRDANWATRRLAGRSPLAEPAMTATAAWVLVRAMALEAERAPKTKGPRRPAGALAAPAAGALDGKPLGEVARARLSPRRVLATVRARADGRLDRVEVAAWTTKQPSDLHDPRRWQALPGWKTVRATGEARWQVDSSFPFVDFDSIWTISRDPFRARAVEGDWRGPVMGWDLVGGEGGVAVFSFHPRIDRTGYIPRRFVEAEPLLEHGLALALAYVNALSLLQAK